MSNLSQLAELSEKFIEQKLTADEERILSNLLDSNEEIRQIFCDNFLCDYFLRDRYQRQQKIKEDLQSLVNQKEDPNDQIRQLETVPDSQSIEELLAEAVRWEKAALPIESSPIPPKNTRHPYHVALDDPVKNVRKSSLKPAGSIRKNPMEKKKSNFFFILRLSCFVSAIIWLSWQGASKPKKAIDPPSELFRPIAKVQEVIDPVWEKDFEPFYRGQNTSARKMNLVSGLIRLKFDSGSQVVVEGPAEIVLNGPNSMFCGLGKISAFVPPSGVGFEIQTPFGKVIDQGTEFFLKVNKEISEVETIRGQIKWDALDQSSRILETGQATRTNSQGKTVSLNESLNGFIGSDDFLHRLIHYTEKEINRKKQQEAVYDRNPSLFARFDLSQGNEKEIPNLSMKGKNDCPSLQLVNCSVGEGPFYNTTATRFGKQSSMARLTTKTEFSSITLAISVQLEDLKNWGNVLFASSPTLDKQGDFLWQITKEGEIVFWVKTSDEALVDTYSSPPIFKKSIFGVWFDIAIVVDHEMKTISHYVNGKQIAAHPWKNPVPLRITNGSLGNITSRKGHLEERYFSGTIDSFRIYDRATIP